MQINANISHQSVIRRSVKAPFKPPASNLPHCATMGLMQLLTTIQSDAQSYIK